MKERRKSDEVYEEYEEVKRKDTNQKEKDWR